MLRTLQFLFYFLVSFILSAQMPGPDGTVSYGNEWIDYEQDYLRIAVPEDGIYRLTAEAIRSVGFPFDQSNPGAWKLVHQGQVIPVMATARGITFYGEKNRAALDRFLFEDPDSEQLNDRFSMYSDTAIYYLHPGEGGQQYAEAAVSGPNQPLSQILRESEIVYGLHHSKTYFRTAGSSIYYSHYDMAEGFGLRSSNDLLSNNGSTETNVSVPIPESVPGDAQLSIRFGLAFDRHRQNISIDGNSVMELESNKWSVEQQSFTFPTAGSSAEINLQGNSGTRDKANIAWANVTYPATTSAAGLSTFIVPAAAQNQALTLTDLGADAGAVQVVNPNTGDLYNATTNGTSATFVLPASSTPVRYQLVRPSLIKSPSSFRSYTFETALPAGDRTNYLILTSERLNGPAIQAMASYRSSPQGGGYGVHVVAAEDLYEEFGYGIGRHPMAIRNYLTSLKNSNPGMQYLFIVGKGREIDVLRSAEDLEAARPTFFVPSFGFPASDNLLTADLGEVVPQLSTGRLSVINENEINIYLQKLRDVENQINLGSQTLEDRDWMKQIMHLGGGGNIGEQNSIRGNLGVFEKIAETSDYGGNITAFFKTSSEPIESSQQDAIFKRINGGTSMITFYGHSSTSGFDFSIDDPANYNNKGRYPYMLSLGCYSGDAFVRSRSISERFILLPDKGAITFAASKGVGFISALRRWAGGLYDLTMNDMYGEGVGDVIRANIDRFKNTTIYTDRLLLEQFALSGDPAYRIHPRPGPDVIVDVASVKTIPDVVPAQDLTFDINFRLVNLGRGGGRDSIDIQFNQQLPSGEIQALATRRVMTPNYDAELAFTLPNPGLSAVGQNRILISLDSNTELAEAPAPAAETNNNLVSGGRAGVPVTFIANTARAAFPPEYAVVSGPVSLVASTTDALAPEREYLIQVSRKRDFSDLVSNVRLQSPGGVIRQPLDIEFQDSTTYYWRISPDSVFTEGAGFIWSEHSFTWLAGNETDKSSWAVQEPGQLVDGKFLNLRRDTINEGWGFAQNNRFVRIFNAPYRSRQMPRFMWDNQLFSTPFPWIERSGMSVIVIDSINDFTWTSNPGNGDYNTVARRSDPWTFNTRTREGRRGMIEFMQNEIPEGKYVFVYSIQRGNNNQNYFNDGWLADESELGTTIFDVLEDQGALEVRRLVNSGSVPYALAFQKNLGLIAEVMAESPTDTIELQANIKSNWDEGQWTTPIAGPAKSWGAVTIKLATENLEDADSTLMTLVGISPSGAITELREFSHDFFANPEYTHSISDVSAVDFPELYLEFNFYDVPNRTSVTVQNVYFSYEGFGDVAINPQIAFERPDSIQQGAPASLSIGYENISDIEMDSLLVQLQVIDNQNRVVEQRTRKGPVLPSASSQITFDLETADLSGDVRLDVRLNPEQDQPEDITFNNSLRTQIGINRDEVAPVLNVFFDGQRINDGDLVSGKPEVRVQIRDENAFLLLNDTAAYQLRLRYPDGSRETFSFADPRIEFIPANETDNQAEIFFRPTLSQDGTHELEISGKDRSENRSGRFNYLKNFEVINEMRISNVLAYPNPFTTQTRFVYTLTGNEIPTMFRIQIMTVSGRVVRDIDLLATESLSIGTHQTEFAWDGTDEYGDQLANGVYLYRVMTSDSSGSQLEKQDTGTDQYFQRGIGKVVLIR